MNVLETLEKRKLYRESAYENSSRQVPLKYTLKQVPLKYYIEISLKASATENL